jgi:hypothetical protein
MKVVPLNEEMRGTAHTGLEYLRPLYELCCPYNGAVGVAVEYNTPVLQVSDIKQVLDENQTINQLLNACMAHSTATALNPPNT